MILHHYVSKPFETYMILNHYVNFLFFFFQNFVKKNKCVHTLYFNLDFLLSNNYVNEIICHEFDFSNDEILAYYIIFLRTLSLKLDSNTLFFFFNEVCYEK